MIISAIMATLVGVLIASPTADFFTLIIRAAISLVPLLIILFIVRGRLRLRGALLSPWMAIATGLVVGVAAVLSSEVALRLLSYIIS